VWPRLTLAVLTSLSWSLYAQVGNVRPIEIKGHFMGESVAELLNKEPEVKQKVTVCEQHSDTRTCERLLAAVERGQRAEVSNSRWMSFVLDGGKLVKLTTLVDDPLDVVEANLTEKLGHRFNETAFPMQNAMGARWEDHMYLWDTPAVHVGLHEDNNPASQNHHLVLVVESQADLAVEHVDQTSR
jgi:hypothetical protein